MSCAASPLALQHLACAFPNWPQMENILLKLDGFLSVALHSQLKATTKRNTNNKNQLNRMRLIAWSILLPDILCG